MNDVLSGYALARWNELRRTLGVARGELALDRIRGFRTMYRASISVDGITLQESDADPFLAVRNAFEEMRRRLEWRAPMMSSP